MAGLYREKAVDSLRTGALSHRAGASTLLVVVALGWPGNDVLGLGDYEVTPADNVPARPQAAGEGVAGQDLNEGARGGDHRLPSNIAAPAGGGAVR
jgi:hypothetical protein